MTTMTKLLRKTWKKIDNYRGIKSFVWLGNIFGIFPCKLVEKRLTFGGRMRRCYIFVIFAMRTYIGIDGAIKIVMNIKDFAVMIALLATVVTHMTAVIADYYITFFLEKRFVKLFEKLTIYDETVAKLGRPRKDRYTIHWFFIALTIAFTIGIIEVELKLMKNESRAALIMKFIYLLLHPVTRVLSILKFDLIVHLMYQRFNHLNESIISSVSWTRELIPKNINNISFDDVMFLHSTILDATTIIIETYSFILMCWFSYLFVSTVLNIYLAKQFSFISVLPYLVSAFVLVIATCAICNMITDEANNAGKSMAKDGLTLIEDSTSMDRVRMQLYLLHNRVVFNAADFFVINLQLFYAMAVIIATYGVLLRRISDTLLAAEKQRTKNNT